MMIKSLLAVMVLAAIATGASASVAADIRSKVAGHISTLAERVDLSTVSLAADTARSALARQAGDISGKCLNAVKSLNPDDLACMSRLSGGLDASGSVTGNSVALLADFICKSDCLNTIINKVLGPCADDFGMTKDDIAQLKSEVAAMEDLLCIEVDGELCIEVITNPATGEFFVDFDDDSTVTDANLAKQCTPCFYAFFNNFFAIAVGAASGADEAEAAGLAMVTAACMYDPITNHYCLPYVENTVECGDAGASTDPAICSAELSEYVCTSTCHARLLAVASAFDSESSAAADDANTALSYLCTQNTNGDYCAALWIEENEAWNASCAADCSGCTADVDALFGSLGCCYQTGLDVYIGTVGSYKASQATAWDDLLRSPSCSSTGTARTVDAACPRRSGTLSTGTLTMTTALDCEYWDAHPADAEAALLADFATSLGVLEGDINNFQVTCTSSARGKSQTLTATGSTQGNQNDRTRLLTNTAKQFDSYDWFSGHYASKSASFYYDKASNSAAGLAASTFTLLAAAALAVLLM